MRLQGGKLEGQAVGILVFDTDFPRIPGDIGNATTYPFPVRFKVVKGVRYEDIVCDEPDISLCTVRLEKEKAGVTLRIPFR